MSDNKDSLRDQQHAFFQTPQQKGDASVSPISNQLGGTNKKRSRVGIVSIIIVLILALVGSGYYISRRLNDGGTVKNIQHKPAIVTPGVAPIFGDTFQNNAAQWNTNPPAGARITLANDGKLILESENHTIFTESLPGSKTFGDLRIDVDAGLTGGDQHNSYGVSIRISTSPTDAVSLYYRFEVYGDGSFALFKGSVDSNGSLRVSSLKNSLQPSNAIAHAASLNHLTIIAKGQTLTFVVNGTTLANFTDGTYSSGYAALFVSQAKGATTPAQAVFQNLALFPV